MPSITTPNPEQTNQKSYTGWLDALLRRGGGRLSPGAVVLHPGPGLFELCIVAGLGFRV